jgi:hypothetical protein
MLNTSNSSQMVGASAFDPSHSPKPSVAQPSVELLSFSAVGQPRSITLRWATGAEYCNTYFAVERSSDGELFTEIGRMMAAGTSLTRREYALVDPQPVIGLSYYRLRQTGKNGEPAYSAVRVVRYNSNGVGAATLSPPTATTEAALNLAAVAPGVYTVEVFEVNGQAVLPALELPAGQTHPLPVSKLPLGAYMVRVANPDTGQTQMLRLLRK